MKIVAAKALPSFRLELKFDNGESGVVELYAHAGRGAFAAWNEPGAFERVSITDQGALEWPGELDLCGDSLYLRMTGKKAEDVFPAMQNRFSHA
jgi:hypothetical protein